MRRGEIYRSHDRVPESGDKPGFYLIVSRTFIARNNDISTVVCAPIYSQILGIRSEVEVGMEEGIPHQSAIRCDFLMLMFKSRLTHRVGSLPVHKISELNQALKYALELL